MTRYHYGLTGETYYAKPEPLVESPWADDAVAGVENGTTGSFSFGIVGGNYAVYQQAGVSPASTDQIVGWFDSLDPGIYPHLRAITANRVIWTWVKNGIDVATANPTIDIMSREGITLIDGPKAATINPRDVQHRYEAASPIFTPRNQYFLVLSATIDGAEVTQDIPINT